MINMAMSKEEAAEYAGEITTASDAADAPRYPYGLCLCLNDEALVKLGIKELPKVGGTMLIQAQVTVTRVSSNQTQGDEAESSVDLQITDMETSAPTRDLAKSLYPDNP